MLTRDKQHGAMQNARSRTCDATTDASSAVTNIGQNMPGGTAAQNVSATCSGKASRKAPCPQ